MWLPMHCKIEKVGIPFFEELDNFTYRKAFSISVLGKTLVGSGCTTPLSRPSVMIFKTSSLSVLSGLNNVSRRILWYDLFCNDDLPAN